MGAITVLSGNSFTSHPKLTHVREETNFALCKFIVSKRVEEEPQIARDHILCLFLFWSVILQNIFLF
jgi:hypothetical protein